MTPGDRARRWLPVAAALGLALFARTRTLPRALGGPVALTDDTDGHYHLVRALAALRDGLRVPASDPWLAWPGGASAPWPPGFDQALALGPWALGLRDDPDAAARVMLLAPVALGLAVVLVAVDLARSLAATPRAQTAAALAAGMLCATNPQAVVTTEVGGTDHHGAEMLFAGLLLRWLVAWRAELDRRAALRWELAGAALLAVGTHVYTGVVIYGAVAVGLVALARLTSPAAPASRLGTGAAASLVAAASLLALDWNWIAAHRPWFHPLQLSLLQPMLLAGAALVAHAVGAASRRPRVGARWAALAPWLLGALGLCAVALAASAGARAALYDGVVRWFGRRDPWMDHIAESRPLFDRLPTTLADWRRSVALGAWQTPLVPLAAWLALRPMDLTRRLLVGGWALAFAALTAVQMRFGRPLVPAMVALEALALTQLAERCARWRPAGLLGDPSPWAAGLCALALGVDPAIRALLSPRDAAPSPVQEAGLFLRALPHPRGRGAGAGVLAPWDRSHDIRDIARRPQVLSGFGPYVGAAQFEAAERALRGGADGLADFMARVDAGHLVIGARQYVRMRGAAGGPLLRGPAGARTASPSFLRAQGAAVLCFGGGGDPAERVAHAASFLPLFAASEAWPGVRPVTPSLWVYARVPGARVEGAAPDGTLVELSVPLVVRGEPVFWRAWAISAGGRFSVVLPLPTGFRTGTVRTGEAYRVTVGGREAGALRVPLGAVLTGEAIAWPSR